METSPERTSHRGELRRFTDRMTVVHANDGKNEIQGMDGIVKAVELNDDVDYGLPNEQACLIALYKAARTGRAIYFNLNFLDDIHGILNDTRENPNIAFYKDDARVPPPWGT